MANFHFHQIFHSHSRFLRVIALCLSFLVLYSISVSGQEKERLESERRKLVSEISYTEKKLVEIRKKKNLSFNEVIILRKQVETREQLLENMAKEINLLNGQISRDQHIVNALRRDLEALKVEYADMIRVAYKNRSNYKNMLFVLSAQDFNQAYQRLKYIRQYNSYRKKQAELIILTQEDIQKRLNESLAKKARKEDLLAGQAEQLIEYESARERKQKVVNSLAQNEKKLKRELAAKQKARKKLDQMIQAAIRREIERAEAEARKKGVTVGDKPLLNSAEKMRLNDGFENSKGSLPWPVDHGFISEHYGENQHPVLKNIKTFNNGVDLSCNNGEVVKAVFDGEVAKIISLPGMQKIVLISHGNYFTVYAHLDNVQVKMGEIIAARQPLAIIYTDVANHKTEMHFEIWQGKSKMNPELWLRK